VPITPALLVHEKRLTDSIVKEELNIFSLDLSHDLEAEEKMLWGVGGVWNPRCEAREIKMNECEVRANLHGPTQIDGG
jgi:hypothetical protein